MKNKEVEQLLDCSKCKLTECIGCDITYTDRKKIKEYIEELEKMIDLMAEWISERCFYKDDYSNSCEIIQDSCNKEDDCKDCIKQYFENKAKE